MADRRTVLLVCGPSSADIRLFPWLERGRML
jgi:hypothetical protein